MMWSSLMGAYRSQVVRPPRFFEEADHHQIETLRDRVPYGWNNGQRDSVESIGEILGETKKHELYRKVGCESWADYCSTFLRESSEGMDELIKGVQILQKSRVSGSISEDNARRAAREADAEKAREQ